MKFFTAVLFYFLLRIYFSTVYIFFYRLCIVYISLWLSVVRFGHWVCGESWYAIKDSLTHRPSSQGWAPGVLPFYVQVCCLSRVCTWMEGWGVEGDFFLFWLVCYKHTFHAVSLLNDEDLQLAARSCVRKHACRKGQPNLTSIDFSAWV